VGTGSNWSRRFDAPIILPDGRKLVTLRDAAEYVLSLPEETQAERPWQFAAECLRNAAEREVAWMWFARPSMMRALRGPSPEPPIGNPREAKGVKWRNARKLARDK
jgi:hypothetical protein